MEGLVLQTAGQQFWLYRGCCQFQSQTREKGMQRSGQEEVRERILGEWVDVGISNKGTQVSSGQGQLSAGKKIKRKTELLRH
jgi:hypothetical protein